MRHWPRCRLDATSRITRAPGHEHRRYGQAGSGSQYTAGEIELDAEARRIVSPFGVPPVINGYDAHALEEALRLREKHGGRVTAVGLGDDSSRDALKRAIAMGADAAVLLNDPQWSNADSAGVGAALAAAVRKIGAFDLVLCGRQASDTDGGQVLYWLARGTRVSMPYRR